MFFSFFCFVYVPLQVVPLLVHVMAIFADLSDDSDVPDASPEPVHLDRLQHSHNDDGSSNVFALAEPDRNNPNINGFSEALACYP